jgi:hypothetical protein
MATTRKIFTANMGGTVATNYIGRRGEIFYDDTTGELRRSDGVTPGGISILTPSNTDRTQGCFHKKANITAAASNTVYAFDWYTDTTAHLTDDVTVTSAQPSRVVLSNDGTYKVFLEMQVKSTGNAERDVFIWLAKNGADIAETAVKIQIRGGGLVNPVYQLLAKQWIIDDIEADDYIELRFALSDHDRISLEYTAAQTTPYARPAVASAVFTITSV